MHSKHLTPLIALFLCLFSGCATPEKIVNSNPAKEPDNKSTQHFRYWKWVTVYTGDKSKTKVSPASYSVNGQTVKFWMAHVFEKPQNIMGKKVSDAQVLVGINCQTNEMTQPLATYVHAPDGEVLSKEGNDPDVNIPPEPYSAEHAAVMFICAFTEKKTIAEKEALIEEWKKFEEANR